MRLLLALAIGAALIAACGSDADKPPHQQAADAFNDWAGSFETAEFHTTALGVGERPTGEFDFSGDARYRKHPESVWTILYLGDRPDDPQDADENFQQLRVDDEEFIWNFGFWQHVGSVDDSASIALENELRSMLGTPLITDRSLLPRWLRCAERTFGDTALEDWREQPSWVVRCRAYQGIEDSDERDAARELVKSVMASLFGQAPGAADQLAELIDSAQIGYLMALQVVIHRETGALLMVDLAITLSQEGARSDIRWQTQLVRYDQPIEFPDVSGVFRN